MESALVDWVIMNQNVVGLKESATLAVNQKAKALRKQGETISHFGFGQSPFDVHPLIQNALREAAHQKDYLPTLGLLELREAFSAFYQNQYGYQFRPDHILVGPGSKELIFQALFTLEGPLLIPAPSWVSYGPQASIRGKHVHIIKTEKENAYKLTAQELDQACQALRVSRQKILILNNPNNPTGSVYRDEEIAAISEVCREHGVIVVSDEIYALTDFSGRAYRGFSEHYPEGTIVTSGLSKGHSAGGYRLGLLAAPQGMGKVIKTLAGMVSETYSSVSAPIQYAAVKAFSGDPEILKYTQNCTRVHQAAGDYLWNRFTKMGLGCVKPEGAFYLFPTSVLFIRRFEKRGSIPPKPFAITF
jgi:aspartate aminotransferase